MYKLICFQVILGVDRLDYTKGLVNRFKSFERLLSDHPEYLGKVMLFQVAVPSRTDVREYQELKEQMDQLVGNIYRDADVALITPLRDGMNLVAKEFVACRTKEPGVLVLSPFAGAGEMMNEVSFKSLIVMIKTYFEFYFCQGTFSKPV